MVVIGTTYACLAILEDSDADVAAVLSCKMKFLVKDCDPNTGEAYDDDGYDDEYEVSVRDAITSSISHG